MDATTLVSETIKNKSVGTQEKIAESQQVETIELSCKEQECCDRATD